MKQLHRVAWTEGMLMAPQHLQYADAYHETMLANRLGMAVADAWGIVRLAVDRASLERGDLRLTRVSGVMPDGTVLDLSEGSEQLPPSRPLTSQFPHTRDSLPVYLTLPHEREGIDNFTQDGARPTRFRRVHQSVHDLAGNPTPAEVPLAQCVPQLTFGDEPREGATSIQILEVVRGPNATFIVSDPYIPPLLRIDASPFLMAALRRLLQAMTTRQRSLSAGRRERTGSTIEFRAEDITSFLLLSTINTYLPPLQHFVDAGDCGPRQAYLLLVQLAGQLATFANGVDPLSFPKFYFDDLRRTFEELFARLLSMLNVEMDQRFVSVALVSDGTGMYRAALEGHPGLFECDQFLLAAQTDMPSEQTAQQLPRLCKVASWADVESILSAATPGAQVQVTYRPPAEIPAKADTLYFNIETANAFWRNIMADRKVAVYLPPLFDPPQTQLLLLGIPGAKRA